MKRATLVTLAIVASLGAARQQGRPEFRDASRNMVLSGWDSFAYKVGQQRNAFTVKGQRINGVWRDQGLRFTASQIDGFVAGSQSTSLGLDEATIRGGVVAVLERDDPATASHQATTLKSELVKYDLQGQEAVITLPNAFTMDSDSQGRNSRGESFTQQITASGTSGRLNITARPAAGVDPLRTGTVAGRVNFRLDRKTATAAGPRASNLIVAGDRADLDFVGAEKTLTITGNVTIDGTEDLNMVGNVTGVNRAIVHFDAQRNPTSIELRADQGKGTATIRDTRRGGGTTGGGGR